MAGEGRRFREAGYQVPKYAISAHGRSLFSWSLESLRSFIDGGWRFIFVVRRADAARAFIAEEAKRLGITLFSVVELDRTTDGQATSALLGGEPIADAAAPIAIYNIDTYVEARALPVSAIRGDGWMPCFPGPGDGWSFVRVEEASGRAVEIREKKRISTHATVGLYYFSSLALYRATYERYYAVPEHLERGERYIAPMYNQLVAEGSAVYIAEVPFDAVHPLGTPQELRDFLEHPPAS
jgi:hypothetical protein